MTIPLPKLPAPVPEVITRCQQSGHLTSQDTGVLVAHIASLDRDPQPGRIRRDIACQLLEILPALLSCFDTTTNHYPNNESRWWKVAGAIMEHTATSASLPASRTEQLVEAAALEVELPIKHRQQPDASAWTYLSAAINDLQEDLASHESIRSELADWLVLSPAIMEINSLWLPPKELNLRRQQIGSIHQQIRRCLSPATTSEQN